MNLNSVPPAERPRRVVEWFDTIGNIFTLKDQGGKIKGE